MGKTLRYAVVLAACALAVSASRRVDAGELGHSGLNVAGYSTLTYSWEDVRGLPSGVSLFESDNLDLTRGVKRRSDLLVNGELLPGLRLEATMAEGYLGSDSRWTLGYGLGDGELTVGDITATLDGNPLLCMRRSLKGMKLEGEIPGGAFDLIVSHARAPVRTEQFSGRNTSGPYYLASSPIVDGSERVDLDGAPLSRGHDYYLNYEIGLLQFDPSIIVPPTSKVTVTYEHYAPGGAGQMTAVRMTHSSGRLSIGTTYAAVGGKKPPSSWPTRDQWLGNNTAGPFTLTQRPIVAGSEQVLVAGMVQTRDLNYQVDYLAGAITFTLPVPMGTPVEVLYRVKSEKAASGEERLFGLDVAFAPSKHTRIEGYVARSGVAAGDGAGAAQFRLAGDWDGLKVEASVRRASPSFSGLDGGQRIDSERSLRVAYRPTRHLSLSGDMRALRQPQFAYFGSVEGPMVARKEQEWRAELAVPRWPSLSYCLTRRSAEPLEGLQGREGSLSESLGLAYARHTFGASASMVRTRATGSLFTGSQGAEPGDPYNAANRSLRFSSWYRPSERLNVSYDAGANSLAAGGGGGSVPAKSRRVAVSYSPSRRVNLSLSNVSQRTGAVPSLSLPAYGSAMTMVSVQYVPSSDWSASLTADRQTFYGSSTTNSAASSVSGALSARPSRYVSVDLQLTRQRVASLSANGMSTNTIMSVGAHVGPWRRLTADVGFHRLNGVLAGSFFPLGSQAGVAGAPETASSAFPETAAYAVSATTAWRGRLAYEIGGRQTMFVEAEQLRGSRYLAAGRTDAGAIGWQYNITDQVNLSLDLRSIRHSDPSDGRRDYSANLFSAQVGFNF